MSTHPTSETGKLVEKLFGVLSENGGRLGVAESCTGGLIGGALTSVPGSSDYFSGGVIAYSNAVKEKQLGVDGDLLNEAGAVSRPVARQMAAGIRGKLRVELGISATGIAGPGGGRPGKPVGLVYLGVSSASADEVWKHEFSGGRFQVRQSTVRAALRHCLKFTEAG